MSVEETAQEVTSEAVESVEAVATDDTLTPEKAAEALSKLLGAEVKPEDIDKFKNLDKWEAKLRRKSMEAPEPKQERPVADTSAQGDTPEFDEATQRALEKFYAAKMDAEVRPVLTAYQREFNENAQDTVEAFLKEHSDIADESPEFIERAKQLWTEPSIRNLKKALSASYAELSADPDKLEARIKAEVEKRLSAGIKEGEEVVEVKPKRGGVTQHRTAEDILNDSTLDWKEKALLLENV